MVYKTVLSSRKISGNSDSSGLIVGSLKSRRLWLIMQMKCKHTIINHRNLCMVYCLNIRSVFLMLHFCAKNSTTSSVSTLACMTTLSHADYKYWTLTGAWTHLVTWELTFFYLSMFISYFQEMDMRSTLAFLTLVTMATAINLRKLFRPVNDDRANYQVPNKLTNSCI